MTPAAARGLLRGYAAVHAANVMQIGEMRRRADEHNALMSATLRSHRKA